MLETRDYAFDTDEKTKRLPASDKCDFFSVLTICQPRTEVVTHFPGTRVQIIVPLLDVIMLL